MTTEDRLAGAVKSLESAEKSISQIENKELILHFIEIELRAVKEKIEDYIRVFRRY